MVKDTLPSLYDLSFDKNSPIWSKEIDWNLCSDVEELFYWFETELIAAKDNLDLLQARAKSFIRDILELKETLTQHTDLLEFLQFDVSVSILRYLTDKKIFTYSYDWLTNSICNEIIESTEREFYPYRLSVFISSKNEFIAKHFNETFLIWTDNLFYYSRCTGGHNELCEIFLNEYFPYIEIALTRLASLNGDIAKTLVQITAWSFQHKKQIYIEKSCKILYAIYCNEPDVQLKKMIAFYFTCAKTSYTSITRKEWCLLVEKEYSELLQGHEHLQLFINNYEYQADAVITKLEEFFKAIDNYHQSLTGSFHSEITINYELARIYTLFSNLINTLLINGKVLVANSVISYYFKIKGELFIRDNILYIIPNTHSGVAYCTEGNVSYTDTNTIKNIPSITALSNNFLSTTHTLDDDLEFKLEAPSRMGAPVSSEGPAFFKAIQEHFDFKRLLYIPNINKVIGFHLVYGVQLPIQPIIAKEANLLLPIIQSYETPAPSRKIKKVLLWQGSPQLSETECKALKDIFDQKSIECKVINYKESNKAEFLSNYNDKTFDLIWICCHGAFNHSEPHKSYIDLGNGIEISIEELSTQKLNHNERRLLIIDACDGATTSLINSPVSIGIAASVINSKQSVISHQWPIDNYSALISGTLLGVFLSEGITYGDALKKTIQTFCLGKETIIDIIKGNCNNSEIIERIDNSSIDFQNFYSWGSLAFFI